MGGGGTGGVGGGMGGGGTGVSRRWYRGLMNSCKISAKLREVAMREYERIAGCCLCTAKRVEKNLCERTRKSVFPCIEHGFGICPRLSSSRPFSNLARRLQYSYG